MEMLPVIEVGEASTSSSTGTETGSHRRIGSFAVFDLETSNLPDYSFNRVSITELCIYGFVVTELENVEFINTKRQRSNSEETAATTQAAPLPVSPRVLHKLTLLLNPRRIIDLRATEITGLDNYMLEHESPFNENAANTVLGFLIHLQQPVCLVAHNGIKFDFPIVKQSFEKLNMHLPHDILCIDSMHAFQNIDERRSNAHTMIITPTTPDRENSMLTNLVQEISTQETADIEVKEEEKAENKPIEKSPNDWRIVNETTPKRPPAITAAKEQRRRRWLNLASTFANITPDTNQTIAAEASTSEHSIRNSQYKSRRALFTPYGGKSQRKKQYSVSYALVKIYERIFRQAPNQSHYAEADVDSLMKLMQHYGNDFLAYAEEHAIPLAEVPKL